ncbi:MAG: cytochrome D1 domain-containing protein [Chthoniobacter sp.]|uniref:cytochrome D1 domain-containing protein n=1 Tax=Chthoniobacter sp. TaxID=2510640 RepID=UPI0032A8073E
MNTHPTSPKRHRVTALALALGFAGLGMAQAEDAAPGWLLVTNKADQTLSIVDPATNKQIATMPEGGNTCHELVATPDGKRAFMPIYGDAGVGKPGSNGQLIRVVDVAKREITDTIDFGRGVRPHCAVYNQKTNLLYVTTEIENTVSIIDPATLKIVGTIPTGEPESHMLAVTRDGKRGYTANVSTGTVSVLDLEQKKLVKTIPVAGKTQRISLSVDDRWVFTSDQTKAQLIVIDTQTNEVANRIDIPDFGYGTAPTPDGKSLLVCCGLGTVAVVDLEAKKVVREFQLPRAPQEILIRPDGAMAYVSCDFSSKVGVIDLKKWELVTLIEVGKNADGLAWAKAQ